jgi:hypothetical protein
MTYAVSFSNAVLPVVIALVLLLYFVFRSQSEKRNTKEGKYRMGVKDA